MYFLGLGNEQKLGEDRPKPVTHPSDVNYDEYLDGIFNEFSDDSFFSEETVPQIPTRITVTTSEDKTAAEEKVIDGQVFEGSLSATHHQSIQEQQPGIKFDSIPESALSPPIQDTLISSSHEESQAFLQQPEVILVSPVQDQRIIGQSHPKTVKDAGLKSELAFKSNPSFDQNSIQSHQTSFVNFNTPPPVDGVQFPDSFQPLPTQSDGDSRFTQQRIASGPASISGTNNFFPVQDNTAPTTRINNFPPVHPHSVRYEDIPSETNYLPPAPIPHYNDDGSSTFQVSQSQYSVQNQVAEPSYSHVTSGQRVVQSIPVQGQVLTQHYNAPAYGVVTIQSSAPSRVPGKSEILCVTSLNYANFEHFI